jgi:hypothetical protein
MSEAKETASGSSDEIRCSGADGLPRGDDFNVQGTAKGLSIEDVPVWYTERGISHVVVSMQEGWTYTACECLVTTQPDEPGTKPKRICRRCREQLKYLRPIETARRHEAEFVAVP